MSVLAGKTGQKLMGLLLLIGICFVPILVSTGFWAGLQSARQELLDLRQRHEKLSSVASFDPNQLNANQEIAKSIFLNDGKPAVLRSELQAKLKEFAAKHGVEVVQASDLEIESADDQPERLGIRIDLNGPTNGILALLNEIVQASPWLFAENYELRSGFADSSDLSVEPPMSARLDVWAYFNRQPDPQQ
jgi:hypothetical protein